MSRNVAPARALWDVRVIGPVLMVVFGLILLVTPPASVGITGSVGNAGVQQKEPPPVDDTTLPPVENPPPPSDPVPPVPSTEPDPESAPDPEPVPEPAVEPEPEPAGDSDDVLGSGEQAPVVESEVLPRTGAGDGTNALATTGGLLLLVGGAALLVAGRRSASSR